MLIHENHIPLVSRLLATVAVTSLLVQVAAADAVQAAPGQLRFTVGRMLQAEHIRQGKFTADGTQLLVEKSVGYDKGNRYPAYNAPAAGTRIYAASSVDGAIGSLCQWDDESGVELGNLSADGARFYYRRLSPQAFRLGVCELSSGRATEFDIGTDADRGYNGLWISNSQLVYRTTSPGHLPWMLERFNEQLELLASAWRRKSRGQESTASALGSGRYVKVNDTLLAGGGLALADVRTGKAVLLSQGEFKVWSASADAQLLAAVQEHRVELNPDKPLSNSSGNRRELVLFDLKRGTQRSICPQCDITPFVTPAWDRAGRTLTFTSFEGPANDTISIWQYDRRSATARRVAHDGFEVLEYATPITNHVSVRMAFFGDGLLVYGRAKTDGNAANASGWYLLRSQQKPRLLTASFGGEAVWVVGTAGERLIAESGGQVWFIDQRGQREWIAGDDQTRASIRPENAGYYDYYTSLRPRFDWLVLTTERRDGQGPVQVSLYDAQSKRIDPIAAVPNEARIVSISVQSRRVAFKTQSVAGGDILYTVGPEGTREITRVNTQWDAMLKGKVVRIDHRGIADEALISWLVVPIDYRPGRRVPTVVDIYPGTVYRNKFSSSFNRSDQSQVWAHYGYATLYASVPMPTTFPFDVMHRLADKVLASVDAAIAQGYVDPERIAVQGHSNGGYGTLAVIAQTNRFKAAIAAAAPANAISSYGQFSADRRFLSEFDSPPAESGMKVAEVTQGGFGTPPWEDPQSYLRNSPLMFVKSMTTPVMLVQGDQDYVALQQGEEMFSALQRLNKDALFVRYWGEWHGLSSPANIRDLWARRLAWYDERLGISRNESGDVLWQGDTLQSRTGVARPYTWFLDLDRKLTDTEKPPVQ